MDVASVPMWAHDAIDHFARTGEVLDGDTVVFDDPIFTIVAREPNLKTAKHKVLLILLSEEGRPVIAVTHAEPA